MSQVGRHLTLMRTTVSGKGRITLPAEIRREDGILPGQEFEFERIARGRYRLTRKMRRNEGLIQLLLACPVKGWFVPMERSEMIRDLWRTHSEDVSSGAQHYNHRNVESQLTPASKKNKP